MTRKLAEWASELRQITKIRPSDASGGKTIPTVVHFGHDPMNLEVIWEMSVKARDKHHLNFASLPLLMVIHLRNASSNDVKF